MIRLAVAVVIISLSFPAEGCLRRRLPDTDFGQYSSIFVGEVTGVRLTAYERYVLAPPSEIVTPTPDDEEITGPVWVTSSTNEYEVHVLVEDVVSGAPEKLIRLLMSGCMIGVPSVGDRGLFFVLTDGIKAIPIYDDSRENDAGDIYTQWVRSVKSGIGR